MKSVIIIGGGIAGLVTGYKLARGGIPCIIIEKKTYPFHRVCGEYISNETLPFLKSLDLFPEEFNPPLLKRFQVSSVNGKSTTLPLDLGGFGISRYTYDNFLFKKAKSIGVKFMLNTEVEAIKFAENKFLIKTKNETLEADVAIGSFGKRSKVDIQLNRNFIRKRSPYVGVKYHILKDNPNDLIALHNFVGGYCGISNIEENKTNLCYLTHRDNVKKYGNIETMEREVLFQNPILKSIFTDAKFLFEKPEVINEISFETKSPVEDHILMIGDAAGMITPLCGNGMAMALHSAKLASDLVIRFCKERDFNREELEKAYSYAWNRNFANRLWVGRQVQRLFGNEMASNIAITLAVHSKSITQTIIRNTHGETF